MNIINKFRRLFKKGLKSIKRNGLWATIKKVVRVLRYKFAFRNLAKQLKLLEGMVDISAFQAAIIFENNFGWNKIMKQRPQQIAENLPADTVMFYHSSEDGDFDGKIRIRKLKDNLILIDLGYYRDVLLEFLSGFYNKYLMVYSTDFIPYDRIKLYEDYRYKVLYEYVDDLNEELSGETYDDLMRRHQWMLGDENVFVISTANNLKEKIEKSSVKVPALITNGVDYTHFAYQEYPVPEDLAPILAQGKTTLCYYGALAAWFDYELIKKVAATDQYSVVLIGQDYDNTLSASGVLEEKNVYFLGRKGYEDLPAYGCNCHICIIPFLINEITESTSPVKLFEYMAMEKPIVTTALPECKKYRSVFCAKDHNAFLSALEKATVAIKQEDYRALLIQEAKENTWQSKAQAMMDFANDQRTHFLRNEITQVLKSEHYDRIIIWRSPFGWNVPLYQRPQHIAKQFSKQGCLVLYEVTIASDTVTTLKREAENLYLVNFENYELHCLIKDTVATVQKPVYIQIYSTNWSMSMEEVEDYRRRGFHILYEYIDDISPELSGTEEIPQYVMDKYRYVMSDPTVPVVTTAAQLYEDVQSKRGETNMVFACNGVDYSFFQEYAPDFPYEPEFLSILNNGKINVCYYGALAKWFDYDLIKKINADGRYNVILFGIEYDESYGESGIASLENVYFLGPKEYHVLKYYAVKMDILTIPFVINTITQATSPLKLFEYMALHKPIVTTAMNECKKYRSVLIAEDHEDFLRQLERAVTLKEDKKYLALLDKEAKENDWSRKAAVIIDLLKENEGQ